MSPQLETAWLEGGEPRRRRSVGVAAESTSEGPTRPAKPSGLPAWRRTRAAARRLRKPWASHGQAMGKPWANHGQTMGKPWTNHGQIMGKPWANHGQTIGKSWANHGQTMGKPWADHGQTMGRPWANRSSDAPPSSRRPMPRQRRACSAVVRLS